MDMTLRRRVLAIARKDLQEIGTNSQFWVPTIVVPLILMGIMPAVLVYVGTHYSMALNNAQTSLGMVKYLPSAVQAELKGLGTDATFAYLFVNYFFAPMFLLVPIMISNIIASNSFAGEKERHTLESLLHTPATDVQLFFGKVLAAFAPAMAMSIISFVMYGIAVNTAGWSAFQRLIFPTPEWIVLLVWASPTFSLLSLALTVLISSRVKGFQEAQQMSGMLVLPVILLVVGQMAGVALVSPRLLVVLGGCALVAAYMIAKAGAKAFSRGKAVVGIR